MSWGLVVISTRWRSSPTTCDLIPSHYSNFGHWSSHCGRVDVTMNQVRKKYQPNRSYHKKTLNILMVVFVMLNFYSLLWLLMHNLIVSGNRSLKEDWLRNYLFIFGVLQYSEWIFSRLISKKTPELKNLIRTKYKNTNSPNII